MVLTNFHLISFDDHHTILPNRLFNFVFLGEGTSRKAQHMA